MDETNMFKTIQQIKDYINPKTMAFKVADGLVPIKGILGDLHTTTMKEIEDFKEWMDKDIIAMSKVYEENGIDEGFYVTLAYLPHIHETMPEFEC
jgi:hypothetical protein